jgi:hypothetical protein
MIKSPLHIRNTFSRCGGTQRLVVSRISNANVNEAQLEKSGWAFFILSFSKALTKKPITQHERNNAVKTFGNGDKQESKMHIKKSIINLEDRMFKGFPVITNNILLGAAA